MGDNREEPPPQRGGTPSGSVAAAGAIENSGSGRRQQAAARGSLSPWLVVMGAVVLLGAVGAALLFHPNQSSDEGPPIDPSDFAARAERILRTTPLIDGHNDLPYLLRLELQNKIYDNETFTFRQNLTSHTDLARLQQGRVGGQFWSVFVECPDNADAALSADDPTHSVRDTLEQIDVTKRFIAAHSDALQYCETAACARAAFTSHRRIASMLGAEGLHQTGGSLAVLRQLCDLGVRYVTVTHNCDNAYATAASTVTAGGADGGLTPFGAAAVREMNRLGIMVDLAHTSHRAMRQVLDVARAPVIFSHTACHGLAPALRNAPDDVVARLRDNGGVLMVMFVRRFLNATDPEAATLETVVDHIFHVAKIAGWDHVGIGGDFDGTVTLAGGIESVADYPKLIEAVLRRGATDEQVRKLVGENILRVWQENEDVAAVLSAQEAPAEDNWEGRKWTRWNNPLPIMIPENPNRIRAVDYI
ncbi:hypothetical protein SLS62_000836 [Diatrype stigma]|uniref:Dipeptidase n=1 Tax=Diatrype stigma TaxID=117547 RepID=A0AAN9V0J4_9PEZI